MNRIENIQITGKAIADTLKESRNIFKKLPAPQAKELMPQVEKEDSKIEAKLRKMDELAKKALEGDTINFGRQLARETKEMAVLLADRTTNSEEVVDTLKNTNGNMHTFDKSKTNRVVRDTTRINKQCKDLIKKAKADAIALAAEATPYALIIPNGSREINISNGSKTCELVFGGVGGLKVKLALSHVLNSGGHCNPTNLDKKEVLGTLSCTYTVTENKTEVKKNPSDKSIEFVLPGDKKEVKVKYNCEYNKKIWCGEKKVAITVGGQQKPPCTIRVLYPGLKMLDVDGTCLVAYQGLGEQSYHPSSVSHYGKPELIQKLREVAEKFSKEYTKKVDKEYSKYKAHRKTWSYIKSVTEKKVLPGITNIPQTKYVQVPYSEKYLKEQGTVGDAEYLYLAVDKKLDYRSRNIDEFDGKTFTEYKNDIYINDMSLVWGGAFRTENNLLYGSKDWGHSGHNKGDDVDISVNKLEWNCKGEEFKKQRLILEKVLEEVFGSDKVLYHGKGINKHWHCTIRTNASYSKKLRIEAGVSKEKVQSYLTASKNKKE